jgi:hypothetical protein
VDFTGFVLEALCACAEPANRTIAATNEKSVKMFLNAFISGL